MKGRYKRGDYFFGKAYQFAPVTAMRSVGMRGSAGEHVAHECGVARVPTSLADLNDQMNDFDTIADIIEREPFGLFRETTEDLLLGK